MYAAVVRSVRVKRFRTYADGKCSEDFHVSIAEGKYCDMQLVNKQCVRLHQREVGKLQLMNKGLAMSSILLLRDLAKPLRVWMCG